MYSWDRSTRTSWWRPDAAVVWTPCQAAPSWSRSRPADRVTPMTTASTDVPRPEAPAEIGISTGSRSGVGRPHRIAAQREPGRIISSSPPQGRGVDGPGVAIGSGALLETKCQQELKPTARTGFESVSQALPVRDLARTHRARLSVIACVSSSPDGLRIASARRDPHAFPRRRAPRTIALAHGQSRCQRSRRRSKSPPAPSACAAPVGNLGEPGVHSCPNTYVSPCSTEHAQELRFRREARPTRAPGRALSRSAALTAALPCRRRRRWCPVGRCSSYRPISAAPQRSAARLLSTADVHGRTHGPRYPARRKGSSQRCGSRPSRAL